MLREYYRMIIYVALVVEILVYILGKITKDEKTGNAALEVCRKNLVYIKRM